MCVQKLFDVFLLNNIEFLGNHQQGGNDVRVLDIRCDQP
jgi:uncharacterized membrane protein